MSTGTLFQCDEDWADRWPRREPPLDPPRCQRCGMDLTDEPVSVLSRHCRVCVDAILAETKDDQS